MTGCRKAPQPWSAAVPAIAMLPLLSLMVPAGAVAQVLGMRAAPSSVNAVPGEPRRLHRRAWFRGRARSAAMRRKAARVRGSVPFDARWSADPSGRCVR